MYIGASQHEVYLSLRRCFAKAQPAELPSEAAWGVLANDGLQYGVSSGLFCHHKHFVVHFLG